MLGPDEGELTFPAAWRRVLLPRRGGAPDLGLSAGEDSIDKLRTLIETHLGLIRPMLAKSISDPDLVEVARAYLDDMAAPKAFGAAVVAAAAAPCVGWGALDQLAVVGDAWVAMGGVAFAAQAVVEMSGVAVSSDRASQPGYQLHRAGMTDAWDYAPHWRAVAGRVRAHLAIASNEEYAATVEALAPYRKWGARARVATSFLVPTQVQWVEADCMTATSGDHDHALLLWCSANTTEQLDLLMDELHNWEMPQLYLMVTALDGVGVCVAPSFIRWFDQEYSDADVKQRVLTVLAQVPTDEAFETLVDRLDRKYVQASVIQMAKRYPGRALRVLAGAANSDTAPGRIASDLLRAHVLGHPDLAAESLPALDPAAQAKVAEISSRVAHPTAPEASLPQLLVSPPWTVKTRTAAKPTVVELTRPDTESLEWQPGEQQAWATARSQYASRWLTPDRPWEQVAVDVHSGRLRAYQEVGFFLSAPEELARPLIRGWQPGDALDPETWVRTVVGRFGLDALPATVVAARAQPASRAGLLAPFASPEVADLMADWFVRLKSVRAVAAAWLERHAADAARALIPAALAKPAGPRRTAEQALRSIAGSGHEAEIRAAAKEYGEAAGAGIEALLSVDPLELVPTRVPILPDWTDPRLLPQVLLHDRKTALPAPAVRHLCTMLAMSTIDDAYAGIPLVREVCDPVSLAQFAWALFERWQAAGLPAKEGWVLSGLRWLGDDETVRRLSPVIRAWPGEGGHSRAVTGLDVLAGIGTDLALMHLHGIAQKVKFKALKDRAGEKITEVAAGLGLTADQLGDRLVPDLGLDAAGSLVLDYGPRRFTVGFDEQLKPYVAAEDGSRRAALPKPGARDDETLATGAYQRFVTLKKDVRTIAADQIARFELAMVNQRRWTGAEFRELFVAHPVLWHIVRRLVWATFAADGSVGTALRVAEDRSLADVADDEFTLPDEASVGIAHPLHLGDSVGPWSEVFADYEILQPFMQLGRSVHTLTDAERASSNLERFTGVTMATGKVIGLERRGWQRGEPQDGGVRVWVLRVIPGGRAIVADIEPGIPVGMMIDEFPEQRFTKIWVNDHADGGWHRPADGLTFGVLDPVTASELLRDLIEATAR
jgi:hypothetical protein